MAGVNILPIPSAYISFSELKDGETFTFKYVNMVTANIVSQIIFICAWTKIMSVRELWLT